MKKIKCFKIKFIVEYEGDNLPTKKDVENACLLGNLDDQGYVSIKEYGGKK